MSQAIGVIRLRPGVTLLGTILMAAAALLTVLLTLLLTGLALPMVVGEEGGASAVPAGLLIIFLGGVPVTTCALAIQAAMARILMAESQGDPVSLRLFLAGGFSRIVPLTGLGLVLNLSLLAGFAVLLFPAFMLAAMWAVAAPALASEKLGVLSALGRSQALTRGHRWKVFGLIALLGAIYFVMLTLSRIAGPIYAAAVGLLGDAGALVAGLHLAGWLLACLAVALWAAFVAAAFACLYLELRTVKEGPLAASLADVFA